MRRYYEVIGYDERNNAHVCKESGSEIAKKMLIDIMVNGDICNETDESVIGKTISCEYTYPYISIAMGVKVEEEP